MNNLIKKLSGLIFTLCFLATVPVNAGLFENLFSRNKGVIFALREKMKNPSFKASEETEDFIAEQLKGPKNPSEKDFAKLAIDLVKDLQSSESQKNILKIKNDSDWEIIFDDICWAICKLKKGDFHEYEVDGLEDTELAKDLISLGKEKGIEFKTEDFDYCTLTKLRYKPIHDTSIKGQPAQAALFDKFKKFIPEAYERFFQELEKVKEEAELKLKPPKPSPCPEPNSNPTPTESDESTGWKATFSSDSARLGYGLGTLGFSGGFIFKVHGWLKAKKSSDGKKTDKPEFTTKDILVTGGCLAGTLACLTALLVTRKKTKSES